MNFSIAASTRHPTTPHPSQFPSGSPPREWLHGATHHNHLSSESSHLRLSLRVVPTEVNRVDIEIIVITQQPFFKLSHHIHFSQKSDISSFCSCTTVWEDTLTSRGPKTKVLETRPASLRTTDVAASNVDVSNVIVLLVILVTFYCCPNVSNLTRAWHRPNVRTLERSTLASSQCQTPPLPMWPVNTHQMREASPSSHNEL